MSRFSYMEQERPVLSAELHGTEGYEAAVGKAYVYFLPNGLYFTANFNNLPSSQELPFHIHEGLLCEDAGGHLLEFPDLFADQYGEASYQLYFDKRTLWEISGKPLVIHVNINGKPQKIACGLLERVL